MAVSLTGSADLITRVGYGRLESPADPLGEWHSILIAVGDLTGGNVVVSQVLDLSFLYSVESLSGTSDGVAGDLIVDWYTALPDKNITYPQWWTRHAAPLITHGATVTYQLAPFPRWPVGGGFEVSGGAPLIRAIFETNTNLVNYVVQSWGYYYDLNARRLSGGPRRYW